MNEHFNFRFPENRGIFKVVEIRFFECFIRGQDAEAILQAIQEYQPSANTCEIGDEQICKYIIDKKKAANIEVDTLDWFAHDFSKKLIYMVVESVHGKGLEVEGKLSFDDAVLPAEEQHLHHTFCLLQRYFNENTTVRSPATLQMFFYALLYWSSLIKKDVTDPQVKAETSPPRKKGIDQEDVYQRKKVKKEAVPWGEILNVFLQRSKSSTYFTAQLVHYGHLLAL